MKSLSGIRVGDKVKFTTLVGGKEVTTFRTVKSVEFGLISVENFAGQKRYPIMAHEIREVQKGAWSW